MKEVTGVWLYRKGAQENGPFEIQVWVEIGGEWYIGITEPSTANFSHALNLQNINIDSLTPVFKGAA